MKVGGYSLADAAGPERDKGVMTIVWDLVQVPNNDFLRWEWIQVPLENDRGYFVVSADYFALGPPSDWCRVPVGGPTAQAIANQYNALLPTAYMVDLIWRHGSTKLNPQPFKDLTGMTSTRRFVEHNALIERQRQGRGGLVVGHKKDVIISNRLELFPTAVCIYGWHQSNGQPIQPVSTAHKQWWYSDYSHGVRLVQKQMVLDGQLVDVEEVWRDPQRAHVLTGGPAYAARTNQNDAVLRVTRYNTALLTASPASPPSRPSNSTLVERPAVDLGVRALQWCQQEIASGVQEEPMGSNAGPRIAQYFKPARRRATGQLLGIDRGDWCAVAQSAALAAAAAPSEAVPHGYRAAVWELEEDARESKAWVPASDIRSGKYSLRPGDLVLWTRGEPSSRLGHVSRVETPPDSNGVMVTLGGNENNAWTRKPRSIAEAQFRGAIKYRDFTRVDFGGRKSQSNQESLSIAEPTTAATNASKVLTEEGWLDFEDEYLPRVVTGENGRAHPAALKAQAIASRTYALRAMQDNPALGRSEPISNSQKFQVFAKKALLPCIEAVRATRGMVAKYQGKLIIANYVAGAIWDNGKPGRDPTRTEKWVTYNEGKTGTGVQPTRLSSTKRSDNRGCMSQNAADWLARAGRTYVDILRYFYGADVEITSVDDKVPLTRELKGQTMYDARMWNMPTASMPRRPTGIEVLAMSGGMQLAPYPTQTQGKCARQAPVMIAGEDPVQLLLTDIQKAHEALKIRVETNLTTDDALRRQYDEYYNGWRYFYMQNYLDTPFRSSTAMEDAMRFKSAIPGWDAMISNRIAQNRAPGSTTYEGKIGTADKGFPVLPVVALVAVVGLAAAFAASKG
jgi:hypothetical protein